MDIQLITAIGTLAASAGTAWGVATSKLKTLETRLAAAGSGRKTDHDLLIEIKTKLDLLIQRACPGA